MTGASSSIGGAAVTRALARERHVRTLATQWEDVLLEVQAGLDDPVGAVKTLVAGSDVTDREQVTSLLVARTERIQLRLSYGPRCAIIV